MVMDFNVISIIYLAIFLPFLSALFGSAFVMRQPNFIAQSVMSIMMIGSCALSFVIFKHIIIDHEVYDIILFDFLNVYGLKSYFAIKMDALSASMLVLVTLVSTCVHIYSISYMHDDDKINRFFTYLSMFTFFMIILIVSDDFIQLFLGWEGVGLSSYLLISFWYKKESASAAALKAFIVNRIGDFALVLGIALCYFVFHAINFDELSKIYTGYLDHKINFFNLFEFKTINLICFLLFIGCMSKSAQFGLHVWLPDAMEGPTPVSALIHAATMVTAGIFLMARCFYLFDASIIKYFILFIGSVTMVFAAIIATMQTDLKRIIAYSTCSQLGYMFVACAAGGYNAGIFHLLIHGFFKALLFLCAGSIIHGTGGEQDINKLPSSLFKYMPYTFILMLIAAFAIVGIPPFAGFYSKDMIIEYLQTAQMGGIGHFGYICSLITVFLTAFYSWKLIFKSFFANPLNANPHKLDDNFNNINIHESGKAILLPMLVLAIFAFISGSILANYFGILTPAYWDGVLNSRIITHAPSFITKHLPLLLSLFGLAMSYYCFMIKRFTYGEDEMSRSKLSTIIYNKFYIDELYKIIFVGPLHWISEKMFYFDSKIFDNYFINGLRDSLYKISRKFIYIHNGLIYKYNLWQLTAIAFFIFYFVTMNK